MRMDDQALSRSFLRVRRLQYGCVILVCSISWRGQIPVSSWIVAARFCLMPSAKQIGQHMQSVLNQPRWFVRCTDCGERNPCGWITGGEFGDVCHRCAERNHGVVF